MKSLFTNIKKLIQVEESPVKLVAENNMAFAAIINLYSISKTFQKVTIGISIAKVSEK
ncbi:MAG: hypothetical protein WCX31_16450 [Salinivirgaceae bacterium]|jgi:hypothetical protein